MSNNNVTQSFNNGNKINPNNPHHHVLKEKGQTGELIIR